MTTPTTQEEDQEHERLRDEAVIMYQRRDEVEQAWREHEESIQRKPAKIVVEIKTHDKVQADTLPF